MSAKITAFYEHIDEIHAILLALKPITLYTKFEPAKGKYKRCYIHLKTIPKNGGNPPQTKQNP